MFQNGGVTLQLLRTLTIDEENKLIIRLQLPVGFEIALRRQLKELHKLQGSNSSWQKSNRFWHGRQNFWNRFPHMSNQGKATCKPQTNITVAKSFHRAKAKWRKVVQRNFLLESNFVLVKIEESIVKITKLGCGFYSVSKTFAIFFFNFQLVFLIFWLISQMEDISKFHKFLFFKFRELVGVDSRSLSLMRVAIGITTIVDLIDRARFVSLVNIHLFQANQTRPRFSIWGSDVRNHYSDYGILPRADTWDYFYNSNWCSLEMISGNDKIVLLLFVLNILIAFLFTIGYKTRLMTVLCWFLLLNIHNRFGFFFCATYLLEDHQRIWFFLFLKTETTSLAIQAIGFIEMFYSFRFSYHLVTFFQSIVWSTNKIRCFLISKRNCGQKKRFLKTIRFSLQISVLWAWSFKYWLCILRLTITKRALPGQQQEQRHFWHFSLIFFDDHSVICWFYFRRFVVSSHLRFMSGKDLEFFCSSFRCFMEQVAYFPFSDTFRCMLDYGCHFDLTLLVG